MDPASILKQLASLNDDLANNKPAARENMLVAAQALVASLQTPSELISCVGWTEPARFACLRTALDLKIFETLAEHDADGGATIEQLAKVTGADEGLVARIMKHLAATHIVAEPSQDKFANTKVSSQFTEPKYRDGILYTYDVAGPAFRDMPAYFAKTQHKQPLNPVDGPFQYAHKTSNHFFPWLGENPVYFGAFANYMAGYREGKHPWFAPDFYPVETQLLRDFAQFQPSDKSPNAPFLVDVGGGKGHDLLALEAYLTANKLPAALVLQDKAEVISSIDPQFPLFEPSTSFSPSSTSNNTTIHAMPHDFFTPQPQHTRGARAYFLHSILHDWDDESCIKILSTLKSALIPGYSKILVHDLIVPDKGATWGVTSMDWLMMALGSVRERTQQDFMRLFEAAGLMVEYVYVYEQGTEGIIEAYLP